MTAKILQILKEITSLFAYGKDNRQILSKIVTLLARRLDCEVCSIYAYDEKSDRLVLAASEGLNPKVIGKFTLAPSEGITGHAFTKNEILNVLDPQRDPRHVPASGSGEEKFNSMLSCPLVVGGRKYGVINLQSTASKRFGEDLVELIRSLSIQVANIIESSKLFGLLSVEPGRAGAAEQELPVEKVLKGSPANEGLAIGKVVFLDRSYDDMEIAQERHDSETKELVVLDKALAAAKKETSEMGERALSMISEADASIFSVHLLFLEDKSILDKVRGRISEGFTAEYSVKSTCDEYLAKFNKMSSEVFRGKSADLKDVMIHLLKEIKKAKGVLQEAGKNPPKGLKYIMAARELLPSDILRMPASNVSGYICERGGVTAHFAILARALDIPAMMGVADLSRIREGDNIILDCHAGNIYINPDAETEERFREVIRTRAGAGMESDAAEAFTRDGVRISVMANLSLLSELPLLKLSGADGVGLYRSEFMYMIRDYPPSEDSQLKIYSRICKACGKRPVTFRMLDAGSDKPLPYLNFTEEENPSMGVRGIRLLEGNEEIFRAQISAILRASVSSRARILIPMVSSLEQVRKVKSLVAEVSASLSAKGVEHNPAPEIGVMIEIPSIAFSLDRILPEIDFGSIGTNDLMQFFYASDRSNEKVFPHLSFHDPSFLGLLRQIGDAFSKAGRKLCVCGEMASDPLAIPLLLGAGVSELSLNNRAVSRTKRLIRGLSADAARSLLDECIGMDGAEQARSACRRLVGYWR